MPKNTNKTKNTGTNFDLTTDSLIERSLNSVFLNLLTEFYSNNEA